MKSPRFQTQERVAAFTLVEVLVSTAIIALIMLVLVSIVDQTSRTWRYTSEKIEKFQDARDGFESMTRKLSQATLNTYWEYLGIVSGGSATLLPRDKNVLSTNYKNFIPKSYGRMSELRFISGPMSTIAGAPATMPYHGVFFQAPFGEVDDVGGDERALNNLLNTWGYFLQVGNKDNRPPFITAAVAKPRYRSRLMEFSLTSERMALNDTPYTDTSNNWFAPVLKVADAPTRTLAENVIALVILPKLSKQDEEYRKTKSGYTVYLSPNYTYNSTLTINPGNVPGTEPGGINPKNQLPPIVQVVMIAIDERSAQRFVDQYPAATVFGPAPGAAFTTNSDKLENPKTATDAGGDLALYEKALIGMGMTYRIFNTNVSIKGAKWSRAQTN